MPPPALEEYAPGADERRDIERRIAHEGVFRLAGTVFRVAADDARTLAGFRVRYGSLEGPPSPSLQSAVEILCSRRDGPPPVLTLLANGRAYRIRGADVDTDSSTTLFHLMTLAVRTHYLIHAGCVVVRGRGVVIAAASGFGKSTLCAHLAARGASLLSDELAPLDRSDGSICPAPFPVGIRPGAGEPLLEGRPVAEVNHRGDRKWLVPLESLSGRPRPESVRPGAIVFVTPRPLPSVATLTRPAGPIRVLFASRCGEFAAALAGVRGIRSIAWGEECGLPFLTLEADDPSRSVPALFACAQRHGVGVAGVRLEGAGAPDFSGKPVITAVPPTAGILEVLKRIHPLQLREIRLAEFSGGTAPVVRELAGLLGAASFFKLTPGRLGRMLALIEGLA